MDLFSIICLALVGVLLAAPAYAYIDPGTGGMLIQLVTGGVAGLAVLARLYWRRVKGAFVKDEGSPSEPRHPAPASSPGPDQRG